MRHTAGPPLRAIKAVVLLRVRISRSARLYSLRASPGKKVTTLSQQPLRLAAHISNKLEYWGQQGEQSQGRAPHSSLGWKAGALMSNARACLITLQGQTRVSALGIKPPLIPFTVGVTQLLALQTLLTGEP